jgi:hypothetical protein
MAFVMLNRFLDLSDAMDDPDSSAAVIENSDFADTDVPFDFHIPQRPYVNEDRREEVGGWGRMQRAQLLSYIQRVLHCFSDKQRQTGTGTSVWASASQQRLAMS